jgi:hypothetical protein
VAEFLMDWLPKQCSKHKWAPKTYESNLSTIQNLIIPYIGSMELQNQESTDLPIYEKQLKETEVGITNMLNAIQMGILTSSTKERLEALEDQRKELQARIAEERLAKPKMKEEFVRFNRKGRFGILF